MARDSANDKFLTVGRLRALLSTLPADMRVYPDIAQNLSLQIEEEYVGWIDIDREILEMENDSVPISSV